MLKWKVLIVSNDPTLSHILEKGLDRIAIDTHGATSLSDAISGISQTEYCLAIVDLRSSGIEKLKWSALSESQALLRCWSLARIWKLRKLLHYTKLG